MGIFKRVKTIVQSDVHGFLDKAEDPINMVKQYIRELEEQLDRAVQALSLQLLAERKHAALIEQTEALLAKRSRQAELAVDREEDAIATIAIREKLIHQERLAHYRSQYQSLQEQTAQLREQIEQMKHTYDALQAKKHYLISRMQAAQAMERASSTLNAFDPNQAARGFARMEEKVWQLEASATARKQAQGQWGSAAAARLDGFEDNVKLELDAMKQQRKESAQG
ncbi:PspA/IM30 family protein [Paenibacillus methanolicus]|uniref:Phage shock protein A n=1 Tax=Paenibacillus methanolicus TaxID=582686 RepID=A0A5S5BT83_9BACL|nr:PspA/IM30 family protein [Paenibacillus methanolicus]TYP69412.1 phage shock protein A [Paenibacillus methanolicus]